ncbi:sulfatase [Ammonifex degensii KC4]|uniref:Sulfatase n=1 Tax=Ammonifex degensii (strain DSM 10501 / KC4) TaxID=429009 RepID=C9RB65_AMMDK|nr:alkaline phosphatase family protein [Ammonifex degensii]ACX51492.1 sulfatase [Ammonifex degensii KC4]
MLWRFICVAFLLFSFWVLPAWAEEETPAHSERFLVLVIDGLDRQVVSPSLTPNISGLGAAGARAEKVSGVFPGTSAAALATLLTGAQPERHRCFFFQDLPAVPGIFRSLASRQAGVFLFLAGKEEWKLPPEEKVKLVHAPDDASLTDKVLACLCEQQPYFLVVVWRGPALVRAAGGGQKDYLQAVKEADTQVGRILQFCYGQQIFDRTFFCLTGTTGDPYLAFKAPEIKAGVALPPVSLVDVAPTLAYFLGVKLPSAEGHVLWNALKPGPERSETYLLEVRVKELSEALYGARSFLYSFLREKELLEREKERISREKEEIKEIIAQKEARIAGLERKLYAWKLALGIFFLFSLLGYWWEYRILRRRYLMF